ncbi:MAG: 4-hydroxy-tetrahydrodipicolinate synthase [Saprospiraceae bacterium]|nr:4-hydroxy-tetrahydrodipicolinate synthase [Saprospiraceae bacterium]
MRYQQFRGTGVALITPFLADTSIDWANLERCIEHVIGGGVEYIVSLGTTGEAITLSSRECQQVFDFTVDKAKGRVPVVAGWFGANSTSHLLERIKNVDLRRADAILCSSPAYNKPAQEGIYQHYLAVAKASPVPVILYNVPSRTSSNVAPETFVRLSHASDNFVGVKEASGNLVQAQYIIKHRASEDFLVLSGDDQITLGMIACGGDGVISVIANSHPAEFSGMVRAALAGDLTTARRLNDQLHDVHPLLYCEGNPVGIKAAMNILGLCDNQLRLPLVPMGKGNYDKLAAEIEKAK